MMQLLVVKGGEVRGAQPISSSCEPPDDRAAAQMIMKAISVARTRTSG